MTATHGPEHQDLETELLMPDDTGIERSVARHLALQVLYEVDSAGHPLGMVMTHRLSQQRLSAKTVDYLQRLVQAVQSRQTALDRAIGGFAPDWPVNQIAIVDRNILRIAVAEFALLDEVPVGVAIDEALALAEMFGAEGTPRFVNGVLGAMADDRPRLTDLLADGEAADTEA